MSRSDDKDLNPIITAITVQTKRELITYHLGENGYFEKFRSERQRPTPAKPPTEKTNKPNKTSLLTPDPPPVPAVMTATTSTPCSTLAPGQA
jgi:hypothetical protein